jgi:predicted metal-dependent HD superfamily phosphohydrolase
VRAGRPYDAGVDATGLPAVSAGGPVPPWLGPRSDAELLARWDDALLAAGTTATRQERESAGLELLDRWREPHRRYHDLEHLSEVLLALDLLAAPTGTERLAAFLHDAVYRGEPGIDEEASAGLATRMLSPLLPAPARDLVVEGVRSTVSHATADAGGSRLIDADLSILAAGEARYLRYTGAVRSEYGRFTDAEFARGRAQVLRGLLERPRIFTTGEGRRLWERRARANVAAELAVHAAS